MKLPLFSRSSIPCAGQSAGRLRTRRWRIASGVRIGRRQRCDLLRDVVLERLNREVGQGDGVVRMLPRAPLVSLIGGRLLGEEVGQALSFSRSIDIVPLPVTRNVTRELGPVTRNVTRHSRCDRATPRDTSSQRPRYLVSRP